MGPLRPAATLLLLWLLVAATVSARVKEVRPNNTCQSVECVILAANMASMMNTSVDPCEDFYSYACGNFPNLVSYNPWNIGPDSVVGSSLFEDITSQMQDKIRRKIYEMLVLDRLPVDDDPDIQDLYNMTRLFFRSCTEWLRVDDDNQLYTYTSVSFMKSIFKHLMYSIRPKAETGKLDLEEIVAAMLRATGTGPVLVEIPWQFTVDASKKNADLTNVSRAIISVPPIDLSMQVSDPWYEEFASFLKSNEIVGSLRLDNVSTTMQIMINDLRLEKLIMSEKIASQCLLNASTQYSLDELEKLTKCAYPGNPFSWTRFFEEVLQSTIDPATKLDVSDATRVISAVNYFKTLPVYSDTDGNFTEQVSYLIFNWLIAYGDFLPRNLRSNWKRAAFNTHSQDSLIFRPKTNRIEGCMELSRSYLRPIFERMYRSAFHPKAFKDVRKLVHQVKKASIESVRRQSWITKAGRSAIEEKIQWVKHSIGLDELKVQELKDFYNATIVAFRAMEFSPEALYFNFGSLMSIVQCASARRKFELISGRSRVTIFLYNNPMEVNAYNYLQMNRIVFPMATLEPPVYHPTYPTYIKLGNLGYTIGHEIGHSFDNEGHKLNRLGADGHFWDNQTEAAYIERVECVRRCYGNYTLFPGRQHNNSNTTLGNDISDIIGIKAAYDTLQMLKNTPGKSMPNLPNIEQLNLNHDQLFFVQAAQGWCFKAENAYLLDMFGGEYSTHSANHVRVTGMMQNSPEFARTFSCNLGQRMHPNNDKCTFW